MKKVTVEFEFPNKYDHDEIVDTITGSVYDNDKKLAEKITYTILDRQ